MDQLLAYLNSLSPSDQAAFAMRCGTSVGYLRKAVSVKQRLSEGLCIRLECESAGVVRLENLRPDVNWAYLEARRSLVTSFTPVHEMAQPATTPTAQGVAHA